jgi:hypothetical protein
LLIQQEAVLDSKRNWFATLNEALESEDLLDTWEVNFPPLQYDSNFSYTCQDGSKYGKFVSIYRDNSGKYERPIHYRR